MPTSEVDDGSLKCVTVLDKEWSAPPPKQRNPKKRMNSRATTTPSRLGNVVVNARLV